MEAEEDIIICCGDFIYSEAVFKKILNVKGKISVSVDDGWYGL